MSYLFMFIAKVTDDILFSWGNIQTYKGERIKSALVRVANMMVFFTVVANIPKDDNYVILLVAIASGVGRYLSFKVDDVMTKDDTYLTVVKYKGDKNALQYAIDELRLNDITVFSVDANYNNQGGKTLMLFIVNKNKKTSKMVKELMPNNATIISSEAKEYL